MAAYETQMYLNLCVINFHPKASFLKYLHWDILHLGRIDLQRKLRACSIVKDEGVCDYLGVKKNFLDH